MRFIQLSYLVRIFQISALRAELMIGFLVVFTNALLQKYT